MRIGLDIRTVGKNRTGDETVTLQLVRNLLKFAQKDQFSLFTDERNGGVLNEIKQKFIGEKENFKIFSVSPTKKAFWTFWSLPRFIRRSPIDILHVQYITPLWIPKKVSLVTTVHDISFARHPQYISSKDLFLLKTFIPLSLNRADKIVAVSEFTKKEIIDVYGIEESKVEVVHNGGAADVFFKKETPSKIEIFKEKEGLPKNFILYIGTLQPRKNIPFLLKSFVEFKQKYAAKDQGEKFELVIGGNRSGHNYDKLIDDKYEEIKRRFPEIASCINFTGFIDDQDLPLYYKSAKCVCIASEYEGFGLPAIEAMASETPVLSTDASCMKEICQDAAMIYKHNDSEDFMKKLEQILFDLECAKGLIVSGKVRAKEFSWEETAKKTLAIYRDLRR